MLLYIREGKEFQRKNQTGTHGTKRTVLPVCCQRRAETTKD
jgi:hypothetical protein